jgi:hypothetical protein
LFTTDSVISPAKFSAVTKAIYASSAATETPIAAIVVLAVVAQTSNAMSCPCIPKIVIPYNIHEPVN